MWPGWFYRLDIMYATYFKDANMAEGKYNCCYVVLEMKINDYKKVYTMYVYTKSALI
jgi:hypothetical protein